MSIVCGLTGLNKDFKEIPKYEGVNIITDFDIEIRDKLKIYKFNGTVIKDGKYIVLSKNLYSGEKKDKLSLEDAHKEFIDYILDKLNQ